MVTTARRRSRKTASRAKRTNPRKPADTKSKAGASPAKKTQSKLLKAALEGDERGILREALVKLTEEAEAADATRLPGLIREIRAVSREMKKLPTGGKNAVDEIAARRERRRAKTARR